MGSNLYFIVRRQSTFSQDVNGNDEQDENQFPVTENPYYHYTGDLGFDSTRKSTNIVEVNGTEIVTATQNIYYAKLWYDCVFWYKCALLECIKLKFYTFSLDIY